MVTQQRPTRYIILSTPRSGSNYLAYLLDSHPAIASYGEPFQPDFLIDNPRRTLFDNTGIFWVFRLFRDIFPTFFISRLIFHSYPHPISAVGFKIFYEHARRGRARRIWQYLKEIPDLAIIHLQRKNLFRSYVSLQTALKTGRFISFRKAPTRSRVTLTLSYEACLRFFREVEKDRRVFSDFFAHKKMCIVYYEQLIENKQTENNRILSFLGVRSRKLQCKVQQQNIYRLSDVVKNYASLKQKFDKTKWRVFFEE